MALWTSAGVPVLLTADSRIVKHYGSQTADNCAKVCTNIWLVYVGEITQTSPVQ